MQNPTTYLPFQPPPPPLMTPLPPAVCSFEVLYLTEPIDEVAVQNLEEYEGLKLADVSREDLQMNDSGEPLYHLIT